MEYLKLFFLIYSVFALVKFCIYFFSSRYYDYRPSNFVKRRKKVSDPLVSVLIPVWNEQENVLHTINSVLSSTYTNLEVMVINDGSTDSTRYLIEREMKELDWIGDNRLVLINQENGGKSVAIENGIQNSTGEYVIVIDGDSLLKKNAIEEIVRRTVDNDWDFATGHIEVANYNSFFGLLQYCEYKLAFDYKKFQDITRSIIVLPGCFSIYKRGPLLESNKLPIGKLTEDMDLTFNLRRGGYKGGYVHSAVIVTEVPETFKQVIKQRVRWRLGGLISIYSNKDMLFDPKVGLWFSFLELPHAILGIFLIFIFPVYLFFSWGGVMDVKYLLDFLLLYLLVDIVYVYPLLSDPETYKKPKIILVLPLIAVLMQVFAFIEFIASHKALLKYFSSNRNSWDKLQRVGIGSAASTS